MAHLRLVEPCEKLVVPAEVVTGPHYDKEIVDVVTSGSSHMSHDERWDHVTADEAYLAERLLAEADKCRKTGVEPGEALLMGASIILEVVRQQTALASDNAA